MAKQKVTVKIKGEETVGKASKKAKAGLQDLDKSSKNISAGMVVAWAAAAVAIAAIGKAVSAAVDAYREQEQAEARFRGALMATGAEATISAQAMFDYAAELQRVTLFGDEATISAMALLQSLADVGEKGLKEVMPLIQDFSVAMGVDLNTAASLVGKTLGSSTNALTRYGVEIDMTGTKEEKLARLTAALDEKFGGMAETVADTATGAMTQLTNAMGDLREEGGRAIAQFMEPAVRWLTEMVQEAARVRRRFLDLKDLMSDAGWSAATNTYERMTSTLRRLASDAEAAREKIAELGVGRYASVELANLAKIEERMETLRRLMRNMADAHAESKQAAEAAGVAELERINREIAANERYMQGLETMIGIIQAEKTEYDKLAETLEYLTGFSWTEDQTYQLGLQADAIEIVKGKMEALLEVVEELTVQYDLFGREVKQAAINLKNLMGMERRTMGTDIQFGRARGAGAAEGGGFDPLASAALKVVDAFMQIESVAAVLDPLGTILESMVAILEPFINTALQPLVDFLADLGEIVGIILTPAFLLLEPVIKSVTLLLSILTFPLKLLADAIEWLLGLIGIDVGGGGGGGGYAGWPSGEGGGRLFPGQWEERRREEEEEDRLIDPGSRTTIMRAPDIYLTIHIENIYGAGGAEQAGMDIARVLREHALAGGQIYIQEAIAPMGS